MIEYILVLELLPETTSDYTCRIGDIFVLNIQEIAKLAGVSVATVSRVINQKPNISAKTYEKVMAVMQQENYSPNAIARGLSLNSMNVIGVIVDDIRNLYRANVVYSLEDQLSQNGYNTLIFNSGPKGSAKFSQVLQQHPDALIFVGSSLGSIDVKNFIEKSFSDKPVLMYNGQLDLPNTISVICDEYIGQQMIADHLYRTGRRTPVYIDYPKTPASQRKLSGFSDKAKELGLNFDKSSIVIADSGGFEGGREAAKSIIGRDVHFDAVVCSLDLLALGAMFILKQYGYRIPQDTAVTGFDNLTYGKLSSPFLTSVDGNVEKMSSVAVDNLIRCIGGGAFPKEPIYILPSLYLGGTS